MFPKDYTGSLSIKFIDVRWERSVSFSRSRPCLAAGNERIPRPSKWQGKKCWNCSPLHLIWRDGLPDAGYPNIAEHRPTLGTQTSQNIAEWKPVISSVLQLKCVSIKFFFKNFRDLTIISRQHSDQVKKTIKCKNNRLTNSLRSDQKCVIYLLYCIRYIYNAFHFVGGCL